MNKISTLTIAITFLVLVFGTYFGYQYYAARMIDGKTFPQILPGKVTLLGVDTGGSGYKIIVSNEIAQLVQVPNGKLEAGSMGDEGGDATDKRRVPLREMILSLKGDETALGELVTTMNDDLHKVRDQIPPNPVIWPTANIEKAVKGDKKLRTKLEHDLNAGLDGTPANFVNVNGLYSGITLDIPVPVKVNVVGTERTLVAHVKVPYRVQFTKSVEDDLKDRGGLNPDDATIKGYYVQEAQKLLNNPRRKEDVASGLEAMFSPGVIQGYAETAERVLNKTKIVLNEGLIQGSTVEENDSNTEKPRYDLVLNLTEEGRERLWQYSRHRVGTQLLLIVNGVAVAAPTVRHELSQSTVTVTQMVDKSLVDDASSVINSARKTAVPSDKG